ncbi:hypothetical protein [Candidatus Borrarchaeum sp.]|uniref:hypothetical protein n=1 Tax=Candidatus Borrarchaeum sp. TaxID=2846742 RepID=UPI00257BBA38|nr:hypothetical protein [Candidatus Borrarchaeum sp.]
MSARINLDIIFFENARINELVKNQLQIICTRVLENIPKDICSLILCGAMSRGEGSAIISENRVKIISDYDFLVVVKNGDLTALQEKLRQLSIDLTKELKLGFLSSVEVHPITKAYLKSLIPTIGNFDLKSSGMILYGEDVLNLIPNFSPKEIPKWDALKILFNRICGQLLSTPPDIFYNDKIPDNILEMNAYQTTKMFLDVCTSLLAFHGRFIPSYVGRVNELERLLDISPSLKEIIPSSTLFQKWLEFKKYPCLNTLSRISTDSGKTPREQCLKAWLDATELIFSVLSYEISSLLRRKITGLSFEINNIIRLTNTIFQNEKLVFHSYKRELLSYINTHKSFCLKHPIKTVNMLISQIFPRSLMYLALLLVYFSTKFIVRGDIRGKYLLDYSRKYLLLLPHMKFPFFENALSSWNTLRIEGLKLRSELFDESFFENSENCSNFLRPS